MFNSPLLQPYKLRLSGQLATSGPVKLTRRAIRVILFLANVLGLGFLIGSLEGACSYVPPPSSNKGDDPPFSPFLCLFIFFINQGGSRAGSDPASFGKSNYSLSLWSWSWSWSWLWLWLWLSLIVLFTPILIDTFIEGY